LPQSPRWYGFSTAGRERITAVLGFASYADMIAALRPA